jgi:hypothetical protein
MKAFLLATAVLFAGVASAQQYKWVDPSDGRVRYGDQPPPGVKAQPLRGPSGPSAPAASAASKSGDRPLTPEQAFQKRQQDAAKDAQADAKAQQEAAAKKENCDRAQGNLRILESGQRIQRVDSKGELYYLEDAERTQEANKARQDVRSWCGTG